MRKIVFQVIQYKPFQILVESFVAERVATSPSVFHFRIRTSFQVPGFEGVHELEGVHDLKGSTNVAFVFDFEFRTVLCGDCVW